MPQFLISTAYVLFLKPDHLHWPWNPSLQKNKPTLGSLNGEQTRLSSPKSH